MTRSGLEVMVLVVLDVSRLGESRVSRSRLASYRVVLLKHGMV